MLSNLACLSRSLVACNVYVSAGGKPHHLPLLLNLLEQAQQLCQPKHPITPPQTLDKRFEVVVVHAYADPVYKRTSFHLAGTAEEVARVASHLACQAIKELRHKQQDEHYTSSVAQDNSTSSTVAHPFVGLVDHVAVMPLESTTTGDEVELSNNDKFTHGDNIHFIPRTPSGWAAQRIGQAMSALPCIQIYYYGDAHPEGTPLAQVRREQTSFFKSGGLVLSSEKHSFSANQEAATVGAPPHFVENYNIRLTAYCDQKTARSLTRRIRERDGGLPGVEALTLPYSEGRWEVAGNLLRPDLASADDIKLLVEKWQRESSQLHLVEACYRVGTTGEQCRETLSAHSTMDDRLRHDREVLDRLRSFLTSTP